MRKPLFSVPIHLRGVALIMLGGGLLLSPAAEAKDRGVNLSAINAVVNRNLEGKVTDTNGDPIPGVNIRVEGTTLGVISDVNGDFKLSVPDGRVTLVFTSVGYLEQKVVVNPGQTVVNVSLEDDSKLMSEVVVVGYGTQKRSDITGSVASVPKERLSNLPVNNVMQAVQGAVANVSVSQASSIPGDAPSTQIRGRNSINASSEPYVVVDGIPLSRTDGSINDINPNDVASIEILKDPSAVAIYGVNGSNGVILITTKRGTTGKPTVRYNTYGGVEEAAHILEPASPEELLRRYAEYSRITNTSLYNGGPVRNQYEWDNYQNGVTTDWLDAVMQTGVVQNHNVGISGGTENAKYFVSLDYLDQKGIVQGYNYKRYSFRTNTDVKATKYLSIGTSTFIVSHNRDGGRANLLQAAAMSPYARMYNEDGSLTQYPMYSEQLWANPLLNTTTNPIRRQWNISLNGYADVNFGNIWRPLAGLNYKFNAGYSFVPVRNNEYYGKSVYNMSGTGTITNNESQTYTLENIVTYNKDFGKHHFDLTGLYAAKEKYWQQAVATGQVFPNDDLEWGNLESASTQTVSSQADKYRSLSQMGRLNYGFDSRYMFTLTVRRDGSSVFGKNNKYGTFPSAALAWNITNESFMQKYSDVLTNLKLRVSYGISGNEAIGVYQTLALMSSGSLAMDGRPYTTLKVQSRMGNDDLQWEKTKGFNTGLDFGLYRNRISGTIDFYKTNTFDMLLLQRIPQITGYNDVWSNIGKVANTGIELTVTSKNIVKPDFSWSSTVVFSTNKNKIVDVYGDGKDDIGNRWFIGHPVGVIYDYTKVGIWQEDEIEQGLNKGWDDTALPGDLKLADLNKDGKVDDNDRSILGQTAPKWTGGLTNTLTYKNFNLNIFIQTVQGALRNNPQIGGASDEMGRRSTPAALGYWTPENRSNEWRSLGNHSNSHGYGFPEDASYTRLKDITLSYNFGQNALNKIGIGGLQLYVSGRNLYTWTNWLGWDPEARDITRGSANDNLNYPMVRTYVLGANITF
ncbi:TonB-dependent receptor plug [Leadbetterella byssophila DSM 17132]|uniref:TonB-dependent receptor plug n=1 Tax=Leadbetterella byssophila (strain DSM 17132 / JCM 16389 / KACC 11308 / NBRC 106382 / 4M15) TaxID=649349 RepID=E4RYF6_LEAB4|nr:TonB-dependent receptor [Leadbetterella byssophila]ADQ18192.1 TonB-dependent receptor plug [Leadbetterella byssophila DSM 17132]